MGSGVCPDSGWLPSVPTLPSLPWAPSGSHFCWVSLLGQEGDEVTPVPGMSPESPGSPRPPGLAGLVQGSMPPQGLASRGR